MLEDQCFRGRRSPPSTLTTTTTTSQVVRHQQQQQQQQQSNKISFGQASFDSCYGSDVDNFCCETTTVSNLCPHYNNTATAATRQQQSATTRDFQAPEKKGNQKLELTLGVYLSATDSNCSEVESEEDEDNIDEEEIFFSNKRPRLTDESILDLIVGSLSESQASDLFQNTSSGKDNFSE
jgi:hypothetical protein